MEYVEEHNGQELLTIDDLAKLLKVSKSTVYSWRHQGRTPPPWLVVLLAGMLLTHVMWLGTVSVKAKVVKWRWCVVDWAVWYLV